VWRYVYAWLSWQPADQGLEAQEAAVGRLRDCLMNADLSAAQASFQHFKMSVRELPCAGPKQEEIEHGLGAAMISVEQRWGALDAYGTHVAAVLARLPIAGAREALERTQLLTNWEVLRQLMEKKGARFTMPDPPAGPADAPAFARKVMEVLDAARQIPPAGRLHSAAHDFEKYPRLLAKLLSSADHPLEAIDLWFAKLLRDDQIRYTTLARVYVAFDEFRRFAQAIDREELDRLIRYLASSAIFFAFQYAFERDQATRFRRQLGERLDLKDQEGVLEQLTHALSRLYANPGYAGVEAALDHLASSERGGLEQVLRATAERLLGNRDGVSSGLVDDRARALLEQTLRLGIFRPGTLRGEESAVPNEAA